MQMFHNKLVDYMRVLRVPRAAVFESARRMARWHYQWMVIHEFLPAIVGKDMADSVYKEVLTGVPIINIKYYKPTNPLGRPFIPVEFSVAAYRFGHSMTRPRYTVRDYVTSRGTVAVSSVPLFEAEPSDNNLNGSRPLPARLKIQWSKFFNAPGAPPHRPARATIRRVAGRRVVLDAPDGSARHGDEREPPLGAEPQAGEAGGSALGTGGGQGDGRDAAHTRTAVAEPSDLREGTHRRQRGESRDAPGEFDEENPKLKQLFAEPGWDGETPLWFYILKEAEIIGRGRELGPVGGRIVAEVLVGLLQKDLNSYLYLQPTWKPTKPIAPERGKFTMADLLKYAGVWS